MKITLISNDILLHKQLTETGYFDEVYLESEIKEDLQTDLILVSDKLIDFNSFTFYCDKAGIEKLHNVYYMLSDIYKNNLSSIVDILTSKSIKFIPPALTINQVCQRIIKEALKDNVCNLNESKNIVVFFGADNKVGTTSVVCSVGNYIAQNSNIKICILSLSDKESVEFVEDKNNTGIDNIKAKIQNRILSLNDLLAACIIKGNLSVLPGTRNLLDVRRYKKTDIEYLIEMASREFNLVIVDAGCNVDCTLTLAALNMPCFKYLISTQSKSSRKNFAKTNEQIFKVLNINSKEFMLIINKYVETAFYLNASELANMIGIPLAGYIPYVDYGWQAEEEGKSILDYNDTDYVNMVENISKVIAQQTCCKINETMKAKKKSWLSSLLKGGDSIASRS